MKKNKLNTKSLVPWNTNWLTKATQSIKILNNILLDRAIYYFNKGFYFVILEKSNNPHENFYLRILNDSFYLKDEDIYRMKKQDYEDYNKGEENFNKVLEIDSNFYLAYWAKGICLGRRGQWQEALIEFDMAIKIAPRFALAYYYRAATIWGLNYNRALVDLNKAIEIDNTFVLPYYLRGGIKQELKDYKGAIEDLTTAIELNPNNELYYDMRGGNKLILRDYQNAIKDFTKAIEIGGGKDYLFISRGKAKNALKDYKGAIEDFSIANEIEPLNDEALNNRANSKYNSHDYKGAIEDYTKAIEIGLRYNQYFNYKLALMNRGLSKNALEDYHGAIEDYTKAIEKTFSDDADLYFHLGNAKFNLKDYISAIECYNKAIELNPKDAKIYIARGNANKYSLLHSEIIYSGENYQEKLKITWEDYNLAIKLHPNNVDFYFARGLFYYETQLLSGAIWDFNKIIDINPAAYPKIYEYLGRAYWQSQKYDEAIRNFNKGIELNDNDENLYFYRSYVKENLNDIDGAIEDLNKAIHLNQFNPDFYIRRAWIKFHYKYDYLAALNDCNIVLKLDSSTPNALSLRNAAKDALNNPAN